MDEQFFLEIWSSLIRSRFWISKCSDQIEVHSFRHGVCQFIAIICHQIKERNSVLRVFIEEENHTNNQIDGQFKIKLQTSALVLLLHNAPELQTPSQNLPSNHPDRTPSIADTQHCWHPKTNHWTNNGKRWWETGILEDICVPRNYMSAPKNARYLSSMFM